MLVRELEKVSEIRYRTTSETMLTGYFSELKLMIQIMKHILHFSELCDELNKVEETDGSENAKRKARGKVK